MWGGRGERVQLNSGELGVLWKDVGTGSAASRSQVKRRGAGRGSLRGEGEVGVGTGEFPRVSEGGERWFSQTPVKGREYLDGSARTQEEPRRKWVSLNLDLPPTLAIARGVQPSSARPPLQPLVSHDGARTGAGRDSAPAPVAAGPCPKRPRRRPFRAPGSR